MFWGHCVVVLHQIKGMMLKCYTLVNVCVASTAMQDGSSTSISPVSHVVHIVSSVNDEAIAMAALSSMADSVCSDHLAPSLEQIATSEEQISTEQVTANAKQIAANVQHVSTERVIVSSERIGSGHLTEVMQLAIDLSPAYAD